MRLKAYLAIDGNSASKLAEAVGVAVSTITRAASGETLPNASTRQRICDATGGRVKPSDMFAAHEENCRLPPVAICGVCERSASDPVCDACTRTDCGLRQKEAA